MWIHIHPETPQDRHIRTVVDVLRKDGVIIYPTDTVYAIGCSINSKKALEKACRLKGIDPEKSRFTCIVDDLKWVGQYALHVSTPDYKLMKRLTPGPYTFIMDASGDIPRHFQSKRKTVGMRITTHPIAQEIVRALGHPILSTSLHKADNEYEPYYTDPREIAEDFEKRVDAVIDGGWGGMEVSTVIDLTGDEPELIRQGAGPVEL